MPYNARRGLAIERETITWYFQPLYNDMDLKNYYKSPIWKHFIKALLENDDTVCELCGCKRWKKLRNNTRKINRVFNIHHKHYNSVGNEKREDVLILCRRCHNLFHDILRINSNYEPILALKETVSKYFQYKKE